MAGRPVTYEREGAVAPRVVERVGPRGDFVRTLFVLHVGGASGPLRSFGGELEWLADAGELHVALGATEPPPVGLDPRAEIHRVDVGPLMRPSGPAAALRTLADVQRQARDLVELVRDLRPHLVVCLTSMVPAALAAAHRAGVPAILYAAELHRGPEVRSRVRRLAGATLIAWGGRRADAVIACSAAVAHQFGSRTPVSVIHPPISPGYAGGEGARFRAAHGIDAGAPCLLSIGNIAPGRDQATLLRALPEVSRVAAGARLVLVGRTREYPKDVAYEAELRRLAAALGISDAVTFAGEQTEVADAYAAADVLINPIAAPESFGRAACEALVAGTPVVSTSVGAIPEALGGISGVRFVPAGDAAAISAAISATLADPGAAADARVGGESILERYSEELSFEAFSRVAGDLVPGLRAAA